ncbi:MULTISPECIES: AAA family ATPase [unclassified Flavobacterium]|uniref:AAA family ATPase n=1 Tax=unclassified Flavobacterium TaxID=196869 RepID=UPI003F904F73
MTFNEFIKVVTPQQVETWWNTIASSEAREKTEEDNCKYMLSKNSKTVPIEYAIDKLGQYFNADLHDFANSVDRRNAFCEAFDFTIVENLVYNDTEVQSFTNFYKSLKNTTTVFQDAVNYLRTIITHNNIDPYKIRFALRENKKQAMLIIGMPAIFAFKEVNGKAIITLSLDKEFYDDYRNKFDEKSEKTYKENEHGNVLATFEINYWHEIPQEVLENHTKELLSIYDATKDTKRATWNTESDTTNSVLKYLIFTRQNIEEFIRNIQPINYWVFQGNPKEFNIVKALEDNALKTWRVKAHKDKIKKGDKVILWSGGKHAGVYALATVDSDVETMPEPEIEKSYYKDQTVYEDKERVFLKIDYNLFSQPVLKTVLENHPWFSKMKVGSQGTNFTATKEEYKSILKLISKMNKLILNISWNSKDWKEESQDKSNHEWVKNGGVPLESWNFASNTAVNTNEHIFGYAKFTNNPKITGKSIFIFYSDKKIVGFYGNGTIVEKKVDDNILNLRGDQNLSFVLENKIVNILEKGYLEDGKRIGQGGFNYLHKNETVIKILNEALNLNPNQKDEITRLKEWFMKETLPNESNVNNTNLINIPLNQILYGPPGTGKTFELQNTLFDNFTIRETALTREQYLESVVADLTWWQVISIAVLDLGKTKVNDIVNHEFIKIKEKLSSSKTVRPTIWGLLQSHTVLECPFVNVSNRSEPLYFSKSEDSKWTIDEKLLDDYYPEAKNILAISNNYKPSNDTLIKNYDFVTFHQSFSYEDFVEGIKPKLDDGETEVAFEIKDGIFKKLCIKAEADPKNKYAIFIDEINRGNVSAIFGELITLIEDDKRLGSANELKVKLPYSKRELGVPSNLYIIGTMNTADRSVEALDTALRRRFSFTEIMPNPALLEEIQFSSFNLSEALKTINERIEVLLDRDHTIGHSYFLKVNSGDTERLKSVFKNNIFPLLQEYFYHDYEKIALILGEGFVRVKENQTVNFAKFKNIDAPEVATQFELIDKIEDIETAVHLLLNRNV